MEFESQKPEFMQDRRIEEIFGRSYEITRDVIEHDAVYGTAYDMTSEDDDPQAASSLVYQELRHFVEASAEIIVRDDLSLDTLHQLSTFVEQRIQKIRGIEPTDPSPEG